MMPPSTTKAFISREAASLGIIFLILFAAAPRLLSAQDSSQKGLADLVVDGTKVGAIQFSVGSGGELLLSTLDLKASLGTLLKPAIAASLFGTNRQIGVGELGLFGIRASLDAANLVLSIDVDPASMRPEILTAQEIVDPGKGEVRYKNADFAATLGGSLDFAPLWQNIGQGTQAIYGGTVRLMPGVYLFGFVGEANGSLSLSPNGSSLGLDTARVLKDFPQLGSRLQAGIIDAPVVSFQGGRQLYGIAFGRKEGLPGWTLSPDLTTGEFLLHKDATVKVFVNGNFTRQLALGAGTYHLSDLPLASGLNEVRIDIEETGLPPREIRLGIPYDQGSLGSGKIDYAIGLGASQDDPTQPFGSAHVAMGLNDVVQIGADAEAGYSSGLTGLSSLASTQLGTFGLVSALSFGLLDKAAALPPAPAFTAFWRFSSFFDERIPRLGLAAQYLGAGFIVPGATQSQVAGYWDFSGQGGVALPGKVGLFSLSGDVGFQAGMVATWSVTAGPSLSIERSTLLSLSGGYDWKSDTGGSPRLSVTLTVAPPDRRTISYQRDLVGQSDSINLGFGLGDNGVLSVSGQNLVGTGSDKSANASASIGLPLATLSASGSLGNDSTTGLSGGQLDLAAASALAYADGHFALTQAPGQALAIVVPSAGMKGQLVELRPRGGAATEVPDGRPAAIANLTPYSPFVANIEMPQSPPDVRPDPASVELHPVYRSITIVNISLAASATIRGTLVDVNGKPMPNLAGDLSMDSGKALDQGATFTDEKGVFECFGLPRGKLTIKWDDGSQCSVDVPAGESGAIFDLGTIVALRPVKAEGGK